MVHISFMKRFLAVSTVIVGVGLVTTINAQTNIKSPHEQSKWSNYLSLGASLNQVENYTVIDNELVGDAHIAGSSEKTPGYMLYLNYDRLYNNGIWQYGGGIGLKAGLVTSVDVFFRGRVNPQYALLGLSKVHPYATAAVGFGYANQATSAYDSLTIESMYFSYSNNHHLFKNWGGEIERGKGELRIYMDLGIGFDISLKNNKAISIGYQALVIPLKTTYVDLTKYQSQVMYIVGLTQNEEFTILNTSRNSLHIFSGIKVGYKF